MKIFYVSFYALKNIFENGSIFKINTGLPSTSKIINMDIDFERHGFKILVEDSSYPEVLEGNLIPVENTIEIERFDFLGIMRQTINKGI
jgi:hypothetical protein